MDASVGSGRVRKDIAGSKFQQVNGMAMECYKKKFK